MKRWSLDSTAGSLAQEFLLSVTTLAPHMSPPNGILGDMQRQKQKQKQNLTFVLELSLCFNLETIDQIFIYLLA